MFNVCGCHLCEQLQPTEPTWKASALLIADEGDGKHGMVSFRQVSPFNPILVNINATGLPKGKHAVHIHAFGDIKEGCKSTGPHVRHILVRTLFRTLISRSILIRHLLPKIDWQYRCSWIRNRGHFVLQFICHTVWPSRYSWPCDCRARETDWVQSHTGSVWGAGRYTSRQSGLISNGGNGCRSNVSLWHHHHHGESPIKTFLSAEINRFNKFIAVFYVCIF